VLRQQIVVLRRGNPARLPFMATDKLVLGWVCRLFPTARDALAIVQPETPRYPGQASVDRTKMREAVLP